MKYNYLENLSSLVIKTDTSPWDLKARSYGSWRSKESFISWGQTPNTKHYFYSTYEGVDNTTRVASKENPPLKMAGFVVDYDSVISDNMKASILERVPTEFMPNMMCSTFSKGVRLIWDFEEAIPISNFFLLKEFLKVVVRKMKFSKIFPGFDKDAFMDPYKYYEAGRQWENLCSDTIPVSILNNWLSLAGNKVTFSPSSIKIPMGLVHEEIEKRFPGRWQGPFEEGARGVRFWDTQADNITSCIVRPDGMQCFTGGASFMSWGNILGAKFMERFQVAKTGDIISGTYYDNKQFWRKNLGKEWENVSKEDYKLELKAKYGLCSRAGKGENVSEVDQTIFKIQQLNRIEAAIAMPHLPKGIIVDRAKKMLNISAVKCLAPSNQHSLKWGEGFEWVASFIDTFFTSDSQKLAFLAWLKWYYDNAYHETPRRGHAIFIAGPTGAGKTFLSTVIVANMVGGAQDASGFFLGDSGRFSDYIFESPLLTLDDTTPTSDEYAHKRYTALIKRLVANEYFVHEGKFIKSQQVRWVGRIIVTCNTDPESIRMLPHTETSILDKVSFFRAAYRPGYKFPEDLMPIVNKQLPFFCRWLLEWEIPKSLLGSRRFGVKGYLEDTLFRTSQYAVSCYALYEVIQEFALRRYKETQSLAWTGRTIELASDIASIDDLEKIARPYVSNIKRFGRELSKIASQDDGFVTCSTKSTKGNLWTITLTQDIIDCFSS